MKRELVALGGPLGAPFGGPPARDPTAKHERVLRTKPPNDRRRERREENEPKEQKNTAPKSMHFLRSKHVFCGFWAPRLGLPAANRTGPKLPNTTRIRARCRGSLSKGLVKHVFVERCWSLRGPKLEENACFGECVARPGCKKQLFFEGRAKTT